MPRPPKNAETSRLSLELDVKVRQRLEELRTLLNADTLTEVVRRALTLFDRVATAKKAGGATVIIRDKDGEHLVEFY